LKEFLKDPVKIGWTVALALFAACWFLPVLADGGRIYIGYDGAKLAHVSFWRLITGGKNDQLFEMSFIAIGWTANESFLAGLFALRRWPRAAQRLFFFAVGVMISWQILFFKEFPLLIGYWMWVGAGLLGCWLTTNRIAQNSDRAVTAELMDRLALFLFAVPILNAVMGTAFEQLGPK